MGVGGKCSADPELHPPIGGLGGLFIKKVIIRIPFYM